MSDSHRVRRPGDDDPLFNLLTVLGGPGGIERSEAEGQRRLVNSDQLPIKGTEDAGVWEALGFKLGAPTDDLFRDVTLPVGWTRKGSGHAMWSYIHDERGRERVAVFYKAAFYDRSAHCHLSPRFVVTRDYENPDALLTMVKEGDAVLYQTETYTGPRDAEFWAKQDAQHVECRVWLDTNRPKWRDPVAQWEDA